MENAKNLFSSFKKSAGRGLAVLGAGALLSSATLAAARWKASQADKTLPEEFLLEIDLEKLNLVETLPSNPLAFLGEAQSQLELARVVKALKEAGGCKVVHVPGDDKRVKGVLARLGSREGLGGMAMAQEFRDAIQKFKQQAAKRGGAVQAPSVAFAPAFGEAGSNGTLQYYVASAFDKVYMQPTGQVGLLGLMSQQVFLRSLLDKIKIKPIFYTRESYKTAAHTFTQTGWTPEHKEMTQALLKSMTGQMFAGISTSRGVNPEAFFSAVAASPLLATEAIQWGKQLGGAGLLDGLWYRHQVLDSLRKSPRLMEVERAKLDKAGKKGPAAAPDPRLARLSVKRYLQIKELSEMGKQTDGWLSDSAWAGLWPANVQKEALPKGTTAGGGLALTSEEAGWVPKSVGKGRPKVAVIHAVGTIVQGPVRQGAQSQEVIDATRLSAQLDQLAKAQDVGAVVLRVSSPGGSALGSDTLHRALVNLRAAGKTLVVSCGDVAASGGMFLAVAGDKIFVQPGTITGSIGVISGKFYAKDLVEEYGINPASIEEGSPNLTMTSPFHIPDAEQEAHIQRSMDNVYEDFLLKVADGRGMSVKAVRALAGGRVFTGQMAVQNGLADYLGGLEDAIETAKRLAKMPLGKDDVAVFSFPPSPVPFLIRLLASMSSGPPTNDPDGVLPKGPGGNAAWGVTDSLLAWAATGLISFTQAGGSMSRGADAARVSSAAAGVAQLAATAGVAQLAATAGVAQLAATARESGAQQGGSMGIALQAAGSALQAAAMCDGAVACFSTEAHMLASTLA